jgi:two-component system, OmpR family, copper resistance phosphate regulon response regulator CusR
VKILVVEDERRMAQVLRKGLEEESHVVQLAGDGSAALELAENSTFDLILLDVMLPGVNGIEVARQLRESRQQVPILMLTARDTVPDVVKGLDAGADDYLTKPFSFAVLFARIRALERRAVEVPKLVLRVADLVLDIAQRRVFRGTREVSLTPKEFRLLEFLMRNEGRVASRRAIVDFVWGPAAENVEENTLDAFVRLLRRKIDEGEDVKLIHTMRGFGYCLEIEPRC